MLGVNSVRSRAGKWMRRLPWLFVLSILVGSAVAVYIHQYEPPVYCAVYTLYAVPKGTSDSSAQNAVMLARDCSLLTRTDTFRNAVLENAVSDGKTHVRVNSVEGTHMFKVQAIGPDAAVARQLADAVGMELCERIARMFGAEDVQEIEKAALPQTPYTAAAGARIGFAAVAAFVLFSVLACCIPESRRCLSFDSPQADAFCLGAVGDTRRLVRRCLKKGKKEQKPSMLLWKADRLIREEIRQIILRIRRSASRDTGHSLVLTAMNAGEEDGALAVLLASELAQQGFRVLLMEMDAQNPQLGRLLHAKARADLFDYLNGRAELNEVIIPTQIQTLSFVDALHPEAGTAGLAATSAFESFIRSAETHFDYVILRAAPRADSTDAYMLGLVAETMILLVRDNACTLEEIEAAAREAARLSKPAGGVVFTRAHR